MGILNAVFSKREKKRTLVGNCAVDSACICHMGYVRGNNEDNFYYCGQYESLEHYSMKEPYADKADTAERRVYGVFDGMGGEQAGEIASYAAVEAVSEYPINDLTKQGLKDFIRFLNEKVCKTAEEGKFRQIGTTATVLIFKDAKVHLVNVGDSPAFLFREGGMHLISEKHTDEALLRQYQIQGRKPQLIQFLGIPEQEFLLEPYIGEVNVRDGDLFLLCSDGLTDLLSEYEIGGILAKKQPVRQMVKQLCSEALSKGGIDNITIIVCKVTVFE